MLRVECTEESAEWIFRALKQLVKLAVHRHQYDRALQWLRQLVAVTPHVNPNYVEESVSRMLAAYAAADPTFLLGVYEVLALLGGDGANKRLWLKINMHKLNSAVDAGRYEECAGLIDLIHRSLALALELTRNIYALELTAAEILVLLGQPPLDLARLTALYRRAMRITTAVTHPRIMGVVRECGAKIQFYRGNYESARLELYESFKNYDEAGSPVKKRILQYLALCLLLTENQFNPFELQETQTYALLDEFAPLIDLIATYDDHDLAGFLRHLARLNATAIARDDIFQHLAAKILHHLRVNILQTLLSAYRRITVAALAQKLEVSADDVQPMVIQCISAGKLEALTVDFVDGYVVVDAAAAIIPPTLTGDDIVCNARCLDAISDEPATLDRFVYQPERTKSSPAAAAPSNRAEAATTWLRLVASGVPLMCEQELSQKDQVYKEQRVSELDAGPPRADSTSEVHALRIWARTIASRQS